MKTLQTIVIAFIAGLAGAYVFYAYQTEKITRENKSASFSNSGYASANELISAAASEPLVSSAASPAEPIDFSLAADKAIPSVVYINSISQSGTSSSYWDLLFGGGGQQTQTSSGSGVIFSADGYILTNNHVVQTAEKIQVIYNKKIYDAELVGTDPSTDLGVLKINETNLPAITLGSSKNLRVGEWVVAVGNPFSLSSTVTAGIVSAKGRKLNIVEDKFPIESFIQTDAAINPGNSGGALVNKNGELVGINTAIYSRTGSYTGYAFAVPIDIARKVAADLIKYGIVQKGVFGGKVTDYDFQNAKKYDLPTDVKLYRGVLLEELDNVGAAKTAGLKFGDIITKVNDIDVNSVSGFEEELAYHNPGDKVTITYLRSNAIGIASVTLRNRDGETGIVKRKLFEDAQLGATLEADDYGVKVFKIRDGLFRKIGLPENYTIVSINRRQVTNPQDVIDFFKQYKGQVFLYGMSGSKEPLPVRFNLQ